MLSANGYQHSCSKNASRPVHRGQHTPDFSLFERIPSCRGNSTGTRTDGLCPTPTKRTHHQPEEAHSKPRHNPRHPSRLLHRRVASPPTSTLPHVQMVANDSQAPNQTRQDSADITRPHIVATKHHSERAGTDYDGATWRRTRVLGFSRLLVALRADPHAFLRAVQEQNASTATSATPTRACWCLTPRHTHTRTGLAWHCPQDLIDPGLEM